MSKKLSFSESQIVNFALLIIDDGYSISDLFKAFPNELSDISEKDFKNLLLEEVLKTKDKELYIALKKEI